MKEVESLRFCNMGLDYTLQTLPAVAVAPSQGHCTLWKTFKHSWEAQQPCHFLRGQEKFTPKNDIQCSLQRAAAAKSLNFRTYFRLQMAFLKVEL